MQQHTEKAHTHKKKIPENKPHVGTEICHLKEKKIAPEWLSKNVE